MIRRIIPLTILIALGFSAIALANGWTLVKKKTVSGQYAATVVSATVPHPHALAVGFTKGSTGTAAWVCQSGASVAEWTKSYKTGGLHVLPHVAGKQSCTITAEVSGSGKLTVLIVKQ